MTEPLPDAVSFEITEPRETPWLGIFFGYVAMVPFVLGSLTFWLASEPWRGAALAITLLWGCAILTFLSGVRRGVSCCWSAISASRFSTRSRLAGSKRRSISRG